MKMKIIGHRGAAGLELENTLSSIKVALDLGVDAVEIDVRLTKDKQVVLCHDDDLSKVSHDSRKIEDLTLDDLRQIKLLNQETVPLLSEALELIGDKAVIIEIKEEHMVRQVLKIIDDFPKAKATVVSFKFKEISLIKELRPSLKAYVCANTNPFELFYIAKAIDADGLDIKFWILNPLTYWLARRSHLDIMVYTVNNRFLAGFIHVFYPKAMICTNNPHYFIHHKP